MQGARARVTTNIVGGLGNQLFLVANLLATAKRNDMQAVLPLCSESSSSEAPRPTYWTSLFEDLDHHGVHLVPTQELEAALAGAVLVPERRPVAPIRLDRGTDRLYNLVGFFQSDGYFRDSPAIRAAISHRLHRLAAAHLRANYGDGDAHLVALHVRRGDYTRLTHIFEPLDVEGYYDRAVRQLLGRLLLPPSGSDPQRRVRLLVFCEEEGYGEGVCRHFERQYGAALSTRLVHAREERACPLSTSPQQPREVVELLMMAHCDDVVMANSTFSWWGAYLNEQPLRRVVAPSRWFVQHPYPLSNHLYCDDWLLL